MIALLRDLRYAWARRQARLDEAEAEADANFHWVHEMLQP